MVSLSLKLTGWNRRKWDVNQYDKIELSLELPEETEKLVNNFMEINFGQKLNPFDPDDLDVYAEFSYQPSDQSRPRIQRINAFYYEGFERDTSGTFLEWDWKEIQEEAGFRIRYSPKEEGKYTCQVYLSIEGRDPLKSDEFSFEVKKSEHPGYVKVGSNGRYFQTENGETFFPIGGNLPPGNFSDPRWDPSKVHVPESKYSVDPYDGEARLFHPYFYTSYMNKLEAISDAGANYFRIIAFPWTTDIEYEKLNNYADRMHIAWELDNIFEKCSELGLKAEYCLQVQYTLENPGYYSHFNWDWPNNTKGCKEGRNGGYCYQKELGLKDPIEFFTDERAIENWQKNFDTSSRDGVIQPISDLFN